MKVGEYAMIIKDEEFYTAGTNFESYCSVLADAIGQYESILTTAAETAIAGGETHDALVLYLEYVNNLMIMTRELGKKYNQMAKNFISELEDIDDFLYDAEYETLRDFTEDERDRLKKLLSDPWCKVTDNLGDWWIKFSRLLGDWRKELQKSKKALLDYNDANEYIIDDIFRNAWSLDNEYAAPTQVSGGDHIATFGCIHLTLLNIISLLSTMTAIIKPDNKRFTVSEIQGTIGKGYNELLETFAVTIAIEKQGLVKDIGVISDFASQPWAATYFGSFSVAFDIGDINVFQTCLFNLFGEFKNNFTGGGMNYETYIVRKNLLATFEDIINKSDLVTNVEDAQEDFKFIIDSFKKPEDILDDKGDEKYKEFLAGLLETAIGGDVKDWGDFIGDVGKIPKYSDALAEYLGLMFVNYTEAMDILNSFETNLGENTNVRAAVVSLKSLFNKEFYSYVWEALKEGLSLGYDAIESAISDAATVSPVCAAITGIKKSIDLVGEVTGWGPEAEAMYNSTVIYNNGHSINEAYQSALDKYLAASPDDENYAQLAQDVSNCFELEKQNYVKLFDEMATATSGAKKAYYLYCKHEAQSMSMYDTVRPDTMSYEDYLASHS